MKVKIKTTNSPIFAWVLSALTFGMTFNAKAFAQVAVVVNSSNGVIVTQDQVKDIFLGKRTRFPDGSVAKPIDQPETQSIRKDFYLKVANMNEGDLNAYWSALIFTGNAVPPKKIGNDADVKNFVKNNANAIGYMEPSSVDSSVRVIYTLK